MEEGQFHQFQNENEKENDDIPEAEEFHEVNENVSDFDSQRRKVREAITKINKDKSTVDVIFKTTLSDGLIPLIKSKGYDVKYYQCYDSRDESYMTRLIITNPSFKSPLDNMVEKVENQFKNFGFGGTAVNINGNDTRDFFNQLFNSFNV